VEVLNQADLRGGQAGMETVLEPAVLHTVTEDIQREMETPDGSVQTITVPASSLPESGPVPLRPGAKRPLARHAGGALQLRARVPAGHRLVAAAGDGAEEAAVR
jgi:hypothetical protein